MARQPWWRATKTLDQSKRSGLLYSALAALSWTLPTDGDSAFIWIIRITATAAGLYFLAAWYVRRSREQQGAG
ncbi:hypothetical protein NUM3379_18790 [Kineococcus sp. NUM-3379]